MIALLGDTHMPRGARRLPDACVEVLRSSSHIVHTGDFTSVATLDELRALGPPISAVHGNVDERPLRELLPGRSVVEVEGVRIGLVHDPGPADGRRARLAGWFPGCELIVYGHTHSPDVTLDAGVWFVNPGSPTERRRAPAHTMAVVVAGQPSLVAL